MGLAMAAGSYAQARDRFPTPPRPVPLGGGARSAVAQPGAQREQPGLRVRLPGVVLYVLPERNLASLQQEIDFPNLSHTDRQMRNGKQRPLMEKLIQQTDALGVMTERNGRKDSIRAPCRCC